MSEYNELYEPEKIINLGGRKVDVSNIPAGKVIKAVTLYNKAVNWYKEQVDQKEYKTVEKYKNMVIDVALYIITPYFSLRNLSKWIKAKLITKRFLLRNCNMKQLDYFFDLALEPILGDQSEKKKIVNNLDKSMDLLMKMQEQDPDGFNKLYQNYVQSMVTN